MSNAEAVHARMGELKNKFVARTVDDVAQMREALARADGGLELIHQLAHRACGTGGTLGLHSLSDAAGALERLIESCPAGSIPDAEVRAEIAARIDVLAAQLAAR